MLLKSDSISLLLLKAGDEKAWKELFDRYYATMCFIARQYLGDDDLAENVVGDLMVHLWEHRRTLDIRESIRAYLIQAVRNRCMDYLKSSYVRNSVVIASQDTFSDLLLADETFPPGKYLEVENLYNEAVRKLPPECREVFLLSREEDMKYKDIADHLGISVNTVKYHMKHALSLLKEFLG